MEMGNRINEVIVETGIKPAPTKVKTPQYCYNGVGYSIWRCPTLTWGIPTLPSALRHFTSEFGMESGRTTALWSPEYSVLASSFVSYSALT